MRCSPFWNMPFSKHPQGRGATLAFDTAMLDTRDQDVTVCRPFRTLPLKDLSFYTHWLGIASAEAPTLASGVKLFKLWKDRFLVRLQAKDESLHSFVVASDSVPSWKTTLQRTNADAQQHQTSQQLAASISSLTETFVNTLQRGFTGTISTAQRTSDKLMTVPRSSLRHDEDRLCVVCNGPITLPAVLTVAPNPAPAAATTAQSSSSSSSSVSSPVPSCGNNASCECKSESTTAEAASGGGLSCSSGDSSSRNVIPTRSVLDATCHACRVILRDVTVAGTVLPPFIAKEFAKVPRPQMRAEISEFLLSDDDDDDDHDVVASAP